MLRVAVRAADRLVRSGLTALLSPRPELAVVSEDLAVVLLWDASEAWELPPGIPVVALALDAAQARLAMSAGARGVVSRDAEPARIAAALVAAHAGLLVVDPEFSPELVPVRPRAVAGEGLTGREREVLALLALGMSNREIATELAISDHTAKFHVAAVLSKLGAQTRAEAVALAARRGLLVL